MSLFQKLTSYVLVLTLFASCSSDDDQDIDDVVNNDSNSKVTAVINGETFASSNIEEAIEAQMVLIPISGNQAYFLTIAGLKIEGTSVKVVGLSFGDDDYSDLAVGKVHSGIANSTGTQYALGTYQHEIGEETQANASSEGSDNAVVTITALDLDERVISGEFTFTAIDDDTQESYVVSEGEFTNISF